MFGQINSSTNLKKTQDPILRKAPKQSSNPYIRDVSQLKATALRAGFYRVYIALNNLHWAILGRR